MGQKVHPYGFRLGIHKDWLSKWYAARKPDYRRMLHEDIAIREHIKKQFYSAGISKVEINRYPNSIIVKVHTARPGIVIGKEGQNVEALRSWIRELTKKEVQVSIIEVKDPETDAQLVAENVARKLEARVNFRRAMKQAVSQAMRRGIQGIKIACSGRLGGAEIARTEWYRVGRLPLQTIRADIDYGFGLAVTKYGSIGVKVWIFKGELLPEGMRQIKI